MKHLSPWEALNFLMISPFFLRKLLGHYNPFWGVFLDILKCHLWQPVSFTGNLSPCLTITLYQGRKWALLNLKRINLKENVEVCKCNACNRKIAIGRRSANAKPTSAWLILFGLISFFLLPLLTWGSHFCQYNSLCSKAQCNSPNRRDFDEVPNLGKQLPWKCCSIKEEEWEAKVSAPKCSQLLIQVSQIPELHGLSPAQDLNPPPLKNMHE